MCLSVLMPVYNGEKFLAPAIESVLSQTYRDFELIIVNDGSDDDSGTIISEYARRDSRIKVLEHANRGMGESLNRAIAAAQYDWLARMDADDLMMPNRLERQLAFLEANPGTAVAASLVYYIDANGKVIGRKNVERGLNNRLQASASSNELVGVHHPTVIIRKEVVAEVGGYRPQFWPADDLDLWNRIIEQGHLVLVQPEHLMKYRIHSTSASVAKSREAVRKISWTKACMLARRSGNAEPEWTEFLQQRASRALLQRVNDVRKEYAKIFYKSAASNMARRHYPLLLGYLLGALFLQPGFVLKQIRHRFWLRNYAG